MTKVMYFAGLYGRSILVIVVLLLVFAGCSDKTEKTHERISQQQNSSLPQETNDLDISIEEVKKDNGIVKINGWAAVKMQDSKNSSIYCVLKSGNKICIFDTLQLYKRPDVTAYFRINRDDSGFNARIPLNKLGKGEYQIGIVLRKDNNVHFQYYGSTLSL